MRPIICVLILLSHLMQAYSQPINDDCINAISIPFSLSEKDIILTNGDTRNATLSNVPVQVCSQYWLDDDVWFHFTTPFSIVPYGFTVKTYFDYFTDTTDVRAIGMALYASCDSAAAPLRCFSSSDPKENTLTLDEPCIEQNQTYYVRIWSTGNTQATAGKFRIGVFVNQSQLGPLWKETFDNGIENNGWTTHGTCKEPDSNHNAGFRYRADGVFDDGAYIYAGFAINSPSLCDGAVGVDSDYNNTYGIESSWSGPCDNPSMHYLTSPVIHSGDWNVPGITLTWHQAIRNFMSHHFIGYRWRDTGTEWSEWIEAEVNVEFPRFGDLVTDDIQRHLLPNAAHHDSLQFRFRYEDNFYFWIIDDVELVATEANNLALDKEFYAIPPFAQIPADQAGEYFALAGIRNKGAVEQHNVQLHHVLKKENSGEPVDEQTANVGDLLPLESSKWLIPNSVFIPGEAGNFTGTYTVTQEETDFDTTDNGLDYNFSIGGTTFANEDGATRVFNFQRASVFIKVESWGYGNVFYPVKDIAVTGLTFGVYLQEPLPGDSINLNLIEWEDLNDDQYAQVSERTLVGSSTYYFQEEEEELISTVPLTNVIDPGSQVFMHGDRIYFAMMEYPSYYFGNVGRVQMLASEARNFEPTVAAFDSAYEHGLTDQRRYMSVLQFSPDGVISNSNFDVKPFPSSYHPGDHIVPMIRIETGLINSIGHENSPDRISVFPNPAHDFIQVSFDSNLPTDDINITMYDITGRHCNLPAHIQSNAGEWRIDVSDLSSGVYWISVQEGKKIYGKTVAVFGKH